MALNLKTLGTRALTAAIFVAVLLSCICYNYISFTFLFFVVSIWGLIEFYQLTEKMGAKPYKFLGILSALIIYGSGIFHSANLISLYNFPVTAFIFPVVFLIFISALFSKTENPFLNSVYTVAGLIYVVIPFVLLNEIACIDKTFKVTSHYYLNFNPHLILGIILLIWANDTAAYLVGSLMGKNKLYERISPGKTWEGTIGGGILTLGCSVIISNWFPELSLMQWMPVALIIVVIGTCGDLIESMLKRQANVKDSGKIMPGHGGILDRFDSLIFVSPFVYAYLSWLFS